MAVDPNEVGPNEVGPNEVDPMEGDRVDPNEVGPMEGDRVGPIEGDRYRIFLSQQRRSEFSTSSRPASSSTCHQRTSLISSTEAVAPPKDVAFETPL